MKIIIIGFGSIGRRHYKNLLKSGFNDVYVFDIEKNAVAEQAIKTIGKIDLETLRNFDAAFICNPNNLHIKTALKCADAGCHLFIEKPLSHNLKDLDKLRKICEKKKLVSMVGCDMRFHPCLQFIKKYLQSKKLGKIYSIHNEFGYFLPFWRPKQDYRKNYAAKKETGGGIILDDIHEFDLLFWYNNFQGVKKQKFIFDKVSDLKIETEDNCMAIFQFDNKVFGSVRSDYLQKFNSRSCKVVGEKGNLEWREDENAVWLCENNRKSKIFIDHKHDVNEPYVNEIKYFFDCVRKRKQTFNDIKTASNVLARCLKRN